MTDPLAADASATREFFVDMLVRDIGVDAAILDLIDNAVDAAYKQVGDDGNFEAFHVDVRLDADRFEISDNCGGIEIATARRYAFRFGRTPEFNPDSKIGEFGIGMKRAVFRLGKKFRVDSSTASERFIVDVDVDEWRMQQGDWTFPMNVAVDPIEDAGTRIEVRELHEGVKELFSQDSYPPRIVGEVADRHSETIKKGFQITVNNAPADLRRHELLFGAGIIPEHQRVELLSGGHTVELRIIAGIGPDRRPVTESGWYVYCNGRLVLKADRTALTGWDTGDAGGSSGMPAWHPQYARFRGFVFFTSEYPGALPWTTTKTEIDRFSDVYRNALARMRSIIRKFADYTNHLSQERDRFEESDGNVSRNIGMALNQAQRKLVSDVPLGKFSVPDREESVRPSTPSGPPTTNIAFKAQRSHVKELKDALRLSTNRQVGEAAFERLYEEEIG